jgi:hypothetical protein
MMVRHFYFIKKNRKISFLENSVADFKPPWDQIKEDIDRWYQTSNDDTLDLTVKFLHEKN